MLQRPKPVLNLVFLAPSRSGLGESLLITTILGVPLGESDGKTPTGSVAVVDPTGAKFI